MMIGPVPEDLKAIAAAMKKRVEELKTAIAMEEADTLIPSGKRVFVSVSVLGRSGPLRGEYVRSSRKLLVLRVPEWKVEMLVAMKYVTCASVYVEEPRG